MPGFLHSFKESVLGKEVNILICSLPRRIPLDIYYTYFGGRPRSHRLEFRKGKRTIFEMFLSRYGVDMSQLRLALEGQRCCNAGDPSVFAFWTRLALRLSAGELIFCQDIFAGPSSELKSRLGEASSTYRYRLARCRKGAQDALVLVSTRYSSQSSAFRKEKHLQFNWQKLSTDESRMIANCLHRFMNSAEFARVLEKELAE